MPSRSASDSSVSCSGPVPATVRVQAPYSRTQARRRTSSPFSGTSRPTKPMASGAWGSTASARGTGSPSCGMDSAARPGNSERTRPVTTALAPTIPVARERVRRRRSLGQQGIGAAQAVGAEGQGRDAQLACKAGDTGRDAGGRLLLHLHDVGAEVGQEPAQRARCARRRGRRSPPVRSWGSGRSGRRCLPRTASPAARAPPGGVQRAGTATATAAPCPTRAWSLPRDAGEA